MFKNCWRFPPSRTGKIDQNDMVQGRWRWRPELWRFQSALTSSALFTTENLLILSGPGGGGAQRPRWPNSQLTIRNLLLYDAETWWLLVFILKAHSDQILAKLINQGGCCCSFVIKTSQNFENEKIFLCLKIVEIDMGGQFWVEKNDSGHKNSFFLKLNPFSGGK